MSILSFFAHAGETRPPPWNDWWFMSAGRQTYAGVSVDENYAKNCSACLAATRIISGSAACLPLNLIREIDPDNKEIQRTHPTHKIIHDRPNDELDTVTYRLTAIDHQVNWGNHFGEIERDPATGRPAKLHIIHPSRIPEQNYCLDEFGSKVYLVNNEDGAPPTRIPAEDMFHVRSVISHHCNPVFGKGVVQCARETIGYSIAMERQGAAYFKNGARPLIVLKGGKFKSHEDREFYRRTWMEVHGGAGNNAKPAMLPDGADLSTVQFNADDSQFLESREFVVEDIGRWYGVPSTMLNDLRKATMNNVEFQSIDFVRFSLVFWLNIWEQQIKLKLLNQQERDQGYFAKHTLEGILRGDTKARAEFYTKMWQIGVFSVILRFEDRNPIGPDGDKHFVPVQYTTLTAAGALPIEETVDMQAEFEQVSRGMKKHGEAMDAMLYWMTDMQGRQQAIQSQQDLLTFESRQGVSRIENVVERHSLNGKATTLIERLETQQAVIEHQNEELARLKKSQEESAGAEVNRIWKQMLAVEANGIKRAGEDPARFMDKLDKHTTSWKRKTADALLPSVITWFAAKDDQRNPSAVVGHVVNQHAAQSYNEALDAADGDGEGFQERLKAVVESWTERTLNFAEEGISCS